MKNIRIKRIFTLFTAFILCFACGACKGAENSSSLAQNTVVKSGGKNHLNLLYSASDTFNPYTLKTDINRQLCQLLYEPLISLDNEFNLVYKTASDVKVSKKQCTVTLKNLKFSDGSALTADDVVYSYNLAKKSDGYYSKQLYEVTSASAKNSSTVIFNLTKADPYFANLLTFPIIKTGSEKKSNSDGKPHPPIGSGKFKVNDDGTGLTVNPNYYKKSGNITEIRLINAPDSDSVTHYVEIGAADMYYNSISNGTILRMSGKKTDINLNNIVYIGVNQNIDLLAENSLRQAISSGIDRKKICQDAFYNNAVPATGFFSPVWRVTKSVQNIQIDANSQITVENLEKIGYNKLNKDNKRVNASGKTLSFSLLVNSENPFKTAVARLIASQLKDYGITVKVVEKKYADYLNLLKKGEFELFLGEVKLTENMDISCTAVKGGSAAYGFKTATKGKNSNDGKSANTASKSNKKETDDTESRIEDVLKGFYSGKNTVTDLASVLQTEMPFIPVCYRTGALFYNDNIENVNNSSASDIYSSIESYIYN